ncbi:MAG TPA: glycosyltransferase, partial [Bacteroidales bacterium]
AFSISNDFLNSDFYLVILGDYEQRYLTYYEYLLDLVEKNGLYKKIEFRGYVSGMEKEKLFAESYFTFLPSQTENFGNVVIESLNQATPVVASKKTPWEILKKAECGFWIDNTSDEIAKIIDHIICLPQQDYLQYRKKSVQLVDKYFNINNRIQEWIEVYNNLEKKPKTCGN